MVSIIGKIEIGSDYTLVKSGVFDDTGVTRIHNLAVLQYFPPFFNKVFYIEA